MSEVKFVSRSEWLDARKRLLEKEKEFTRAREALSVERRDLSMVRVETDYQFDTVRGPATLSELFKGRRQLIVYHFMFGETWKQGCPSCSFWMDNFDGVDVHLAARDTTFVAVSTAKLETLMAYRQRMGWQFDWVSSGDNGFNRDYGVTFPGKQPGPTGGYNYTDNIFSEELPGVSVFRRFEDGVVAHSYSSYGRGLDTLNGAYQLLDLTPLGRNEGDLPNPQSWVRRRDQY